jgi:branched-subunit amino acid aminotransferase/4-amino-4-deoxychorismate lyase
VRRPVADVHAALSGAGVAVYTGLRSRGPRGLESLSAHLARLADSCARVGLSAPDEAALRRALAAVVPTDDPHGCMVRIEVRAVPAPALDTDATTLIALWPARLPDPAVRRDGVAVVTAPGARRVRPAAKGSAWVQERRGWLRDPAAAEHLLLTPGGALLEGFTSNVLGVVDGAVLAPAEGVLPGVTMARVLALCETLGVPVHRRPIPPGDDLTELAITSSGRGIWPVTRLDGRSVGGGRPGPVVARLLRAWDAALPGRLERP